MNDSRRGRYEAFLHYFLVNEYTKDEIVEMFLYSISDDELARLVEQVSPSEPEVEYTPVSSGYSYTVLLE